MVAKEATPTETRPAATSTSVPKNEEEELKKGARPVVEEEEEEERKEQEHAAEEDQAATTTTSVVATQTEAFTRQLDRFEHDGREGFRSGKHNYAYEQFKQGLKAVADIFQLIDRDADEAADVDDDDQRAELRLLREMYEERQRRFAVNAAAACIKIGHYVQGLECCNVVLVERGSSDVAQLQKATFRAGVCARHLGDLAQAKSYQQALLAMEEPDKLDDKVRRDVLKELQAIKIEADHSRAFAKNMLSGKGCDISTMNSTVEGTTNKHKTPTTEELQRSAEVEEKRRQFISNKEREKKIAKEKATTTKRSVTVKAPDVLIPEADCLAMLDTLAQRYAKKEVQDAIKEATMDHAYRMTKGFIVRSHRILSPLQKDVFRQYGFGGEEEEDENTGAATTPATTPNDAVTDFERDYAHHAKVKRRFEQTVRYMSQDNEQIRDKALLCRKLALGGDGGILDAENMELKHE